MQNVLTHMVLSICAGYVLKNVRLSRAHSCLLRFEQLAEFLCSCERYLSRTTWDRRKKQLLILKTSPAPVDQVFHPADRDRSICATDWTASSRTRKKNGNGQRRSPKGVNLEDMAVP